LDRVALEIAGITFEEAFRILIKYAGFRRSHKGSPYKTKLLCLSEGCFVIQFVEYFHVREGFPKKAHPFLVRTAVNLPPFRFKLGMRLGDGGVHAHGLLLFQ
jgi:hypothetical protein